MTVFDKLSRIIHVCREEQIERSAILDLLRECSRSPKGEAKVDAGFVFKTLTDSFKCGTEVGGCGNGQLTGRRCCLCLGSGARQKNHQYKCMQRVFHSEYISLPSRFSAQ